MTFELSQDRTGEKGAILGRYAERASRFKKQPIQRAQGRNSWRRGKEASVAGAEGPEGTGRDGRKGRAGSQAGRASRLRSTISLIVVKYA